MEVRGQFVGVDYFLPFFSFFFIRLSRIKNHVVKLDGKLLYWLSHFIAQ